MSAHSKVVIDKFCELCLWLHQACQTRKFLFDENPDWDNLKQPHYEHFFWRLSVILQEYWLHQLSKLHDPAVQGGNINLSIDYMIEYGQWDPKTECELKELRAKMATLAAPIKKARNKMLSHNDLAVILQSEELGSFEQGKDEEYFECLRQFASLVQGELFVYDENVRNDSEFFMSCCNRGRIT